MKLFIFYIFFFMGTLAFADDSTFNIKILNKINLLNYEESKTTNENVKKRLDLQKQELLNYFLQKLENGDYAILNKNDKEKVYINTLLELRLAEEASDNLRIMTAQMQIQIINMERAFEVLLITINEYNNSLKPLHDYKELFVKYSESMIFSNKKYHRYYQKLSKKSLLTPKEEKFVNMYYNFNDRLNVYNEIYFTIASRVTQMLKANTLLTNLEIDKLIVYFNSLDILDSANHFSKKHFYISIG